MDHHDHMNAEPEESPSHLGHEMSPTSAAPMAMEHDHRGMMEQDLRRRFFAVLVLTFPVLALSPTIQSWAGYRLPSLPAASLILAALASIITLYGGLPFFHGAGTALRARTADMDVLVSLAVLSGYLYSVGATFLFAASDVYWEVSTLVLFLLFGHWMEMRSVRGASGALRELVKLIPPSANRVKADGSIEEVETALLALGDVVLVRPGEKVPIAGVVLEGASSVNEALVTGESKPVSKSPGDNVLGGTINGEGALRVRVTKTGEETALAQIVNLVREAQESKPRVQRLADRAATALTLIAVSLGVATFAYWFGVARADSLFALTLMITVFVIACPHAVGLGNRALLQDVNMEPPEEANRLAAQGKTIVHAVIDDRLAGVIALADMIRDESHQAVSDLTAMGIRVAMLTGDNRPTAAYVAGQLGLDAF